MSQSTEPQTDDIQRQRDAIAGTRTDVGRTLEHLEERVSPAHFKERQKARVRSRWERTKRSVMGSDPGDGSLGGQARDVAHQVRDTAEHAPEQVEEAVRGNPIAAGLIAAGIGALVGSMLPPSQPERQLAGELSDRLGEPVRAELQQAGRAVTDDLREDARDRMETIGDTAKDAVDQAKHEIGDGDQRHGGESRSDASTSTPSPSGTPFAPSSSDRRPPPPPGGSTGTPPRTGQIDDPSGPFSS